MIESVWILLNGHVMVYNSSSDQMPEYQGLWNEKKRSIFDAIEVQKREPAIYLCLWNEWQQRIGFEHAKVLLLSIEKPEEKEDGDANRIERKSTERTGKRTNSAIR